MIGLLQRVTQAKVEVDGETVGEINQGLLVLVGVEKNDREEQADRLLERIFNYRVFEDQAGKMNLSLKDIDGGLLLVPQFTLPADTQKGNRPSFTPAASPEKGKQLFDYLLKQSTIKHNKIASGHFGAEMQVSLTNDGPVTFWLQVSNKMPLGL